MILGLLQRVRTTQRSFRMKPALAIEGIRQINVETENSELVARSSRSETLVYTI